MSELKPCPFCGGEAAFGANSCQGFEYVRCASCKARTWSCYDTKDQAAEAWNTRAERTCTIEELELFCDGRPKGITLKCCSECGGVIDDEISRYCPDCGAKVVEG